MFFNDTLTALGQFTVEPEPIRTRLHKVGEHVSTVLEACAELELTPMPALPGGQFDEAWHEAVGHLGAVADSHGRAASGTVNSIREYLVAVNSADRLNGIHQMQNQLPSDHPQSEHSQQQLPVLS